MKIISYNLNVLRIASKLNHLPVILGNVNGKENDL